MNLPFTFDQFLAVFVAYNSAIWPAQLLLNLAAISAAVLCFRKSVPSRLISSILACLCAWTGIIYHWLFFSAINPAALVFGGIFVAQAVLFLWYGVFKGTLIFHFDNSWHAYIGAGFILYGLIVYPILGGLLGHVYPSSPTFGAPCPTTIFVLGMLLWVSNRLKWYKYLLPLIWALIGSSAAFKLGIREDIGLLIAGVVGAILLLTRRKGQEGIVAPNKRL
jgi:hypothetical protein